MNKKVKRLGTAIMLCLILFSVSGMSVSAQIDEDAVKKEEEKIRQEKEKEKEKEQVSLTPDGNLTLIDDIDEEHSDSLQFMTVQTRNGNYFYIIVDRNSKEDNVYFLNMVDEADLLSIIPEDERGIYCDGSCMKEEPAEEPEQTVEVPEEPEKEPVEPETEEEEPEELPEEEPKQKDSKLFLYALILLLGGGAVAAYYFLKLRPGSRDTEIGGDMEFYDDEEYENEDEEPEFSDDEEPDGDEENAGENEPDGEETDNGAYAETAGDTDSEGKARDVEASVHETYFDDEDKSKEVADSHNAATGVPEKAEDPRYNERMARFLEQLNEEDEAESAGTDEGGDC